MAVSAISAWRKMPRALWVLILGAFINRLGGFVLPFMAIYLSERRQLSVSEIGVVVGLWGGGWVVAGPIGGWLADRFGRRRTLLATLVLDAAALLHLGFAQNPVHLGIAAFLLGAIGDMYRPALAAAVVDLVEPADRMRAYGLLYWANNLGFAIASTLAGLLSSIRFEILFIGNAAAALLFAVIVWARLRETRPEQAQAPRAVLEAIRPLRDLRFLPFALLIFAMGLVFAQYTVSLPLDMRAHGISKAQYGVLMTFNGALILLLQPFAAELADRFRPQRVLALSALLLGLGFGVPALGGTLALYALTIGIATLGEIALSPVGPSEAAALSPLDLRGTYQGAYQMAFGAGMAVGPAIGAGLYGHFGPGVLWGTCAVLGALTAVGHLLRGRRVHTSVKAESPSA